MPSPIDFDDAVAVLRIASELEQRTRDLAERRHALVERLSALVGADCGFWGWGRGFPTVSELTPVGCLFYGFESEQQLVRIYGKAMDVEGLRIFSDPFGPLLSPQVAAGQVAQAARSRSMLWTDDQWHASQTYRECLSPEGIGDWMTVVRYPNADTWSNLHLARHLGKEGFSPRDVAVMDLAMAGITWLHVQPHDAIPPEAFVDLSLRQREVLRLLLDGMPRKEIAASLGLAVHTVNDYFKAIYARFEVNSATELTAKFLKSR